MDGRDSVLSYHTKVEARKNMSFVISINHPIKLQMISIFSLESSQTLSFISNRHHSAYICGDFNIDLLQMYTNHYYNDFFETAVSIGFLPQITLPTRIGEAGYRSSLIDITYLQMPLMQ